MKPAPFIRHVPKTLDEALKILAQVAPQGGRILAGGQSLVPIMAFRLAKPAHLVDINEVEGLDRIASDGKALRIGERAIAAPDYFEGIMSTALAEDELLAEAQLPLLSADVKFGFNEFSRRAGDFAMASS